MPDGTKSYTRNGAFSMRNDRTLVTSGGVHRGECGDLGLVIEAAARSSAQQPAGKP